MIIRKEYKFYAAHRNEELQDKCRNLHGHRYGIVCHFEVQRTGSYSTLFSEFDEKITPLIKEQYDHGMLINASDPLYDTLRQHMEAHGEDFKLKVFQGPTSVENLAYHLFTEITDFGFDLVRLDVQETDTSVISYDREDWKRDKQMQVFSAQQPIDVAQS